MMADQVTACGEFKLPNISKPVPVKSKIALLVYLSNVNFNVIGEPSSRNSVSYTKSCSLSPFFNEISTNILRTLSSAFSCIKCI